jgi:SAM-dependent methyltransferase
MPDNPLANASFSVRKKDSSTPRRLLKRIVPGPVRHALRFGYSYGLDALDFCRGRRRDLMPPRYLNFAGDGDFEKTGNEFLTYFIDLGGLQPSHSVLDVGCGIGRMARALTGYLRDGSYEGFDIVPAGIRWCQKNITPRYPNFHFALADIRNTDYNPQGKLSAAEYRFPYADASFDFAFLTSVFTHLLPADAEHYLAELSRVLRPGSKCLATYFLLNEEAKKRIADGSSSLLFHHPLNGCWTINPEIPESAVAYDELKIGEFLENNGFALESIHYGKWSGRSEYLSYQDLLILRKR